MAYEFVRVSSQYISATTTPVTTEPFTLAAFFNSSSAADDQALLSISSATRSITLRARGDAAGDPVSVVKDGSSFTVLDTTAAYSTNTWNSAVGLLSASNSRTVYLNAANNPAPQTTTNTTSADTYSLFLFALRTGVLRTLNGLGAEVAIWSAALTADEITSLSKGFKPSRIRPQSLVFYAPLVRDLIDIKAGLALTNNNAATVAAHPRVY